MTIHDAGDVQAVTLDDSEIAAIIAASIIAGIILFICCIFIIICCVRMRKDARGRGDGETLEGGEKLEGAKVSKLEKGCLAAYIACCPCCIKKEEIVEEEKTVFTFSRFFSSLNPTVEKTVVENERVTGQDSPVGVIRKNFKASIKRLSQRRTLAESPKPKKKFSLPNVSPKTTPKSSPKRIHSKKTTEEDSPISIRVSKNMGENLKKSFKGDSPFIRFQDEEDDKKKKKSRSFK